MNQDVLQDYETYKHIMDDLLHPIKQEGLDYETTKKLYESKLVYLQNLRVKCFYSINSKDKTYFSIDDYILLIQAIKQTRFHLKQLVLDAITLSLGQ